MASYWIDTLVLKNWGKYLRYSAASSLPLRGNPTQAQEVAIRISGAVAGESTQKVNIPSTHHNPYLSHYIIYHLPLVFLSPTSPLPFYSPSLSQSPPLFRLPFCLLVIMSSSLSAPISPEFEVLHFKQRQGENLKDAWYRMMESYRKCTLEVNFRILLRNFYVGLNMSHRQLLDCIAKGIFYWNWS